MPPRFAPPASPRCPRCSKAVYIAEQVIGPNGAAWHKSCFTCKECNRRLDSITLAEHEGEAFCKTCHKKMWGPTGYGYASNLLVREDPESQFKQSIGHPVNSSGSNSGSFNNLDEVVRNSTGGSSSAGLGRQQSDYSGSPRASLEETEDQRRERLTPVNATLKKRNSLDMIREQAEASRRAYDEAHAQRVASKHGRVNTNSTGGSTTSIGSKGTDHLMSGSLHANSGYLSASSESSSVFGSTMATTSSPAPSISSISSATSSQPATKSLFLNQALRSTSNASSTKQFEPQDAESEYEKSRQALSFQTGAPPSSSRSSIDTTPTHTTPPSLPRREPEPAKVVSRQQTLEDQDDDFMDYVPIRIVARKEPHTPTPDVQAVKEDEWDSEPAQKKLTVSTPTQPMYRSQYLKQQQELEQEREPESRPAIASSSTSSTRLNRLISEDDTQNLREQEQRKQQQQSQASSAAVKVDEWDEDPTPSVPSRPQNMSYMPARNVSSAATRTWTPTAKTTSDDYSTSKNNDYSRVGSHEFSSSSTASPVSSSPFNNISTAPKTSYYRSDGLMTPKKAVSSFGGGGDICPRCQKIVYHAESALAPGGAKYHKLCLRCIECSRSLDSTNMTDRQGQPYCKTCYGKAFGVKGYGYGGGASMLHTEL